MNLDYSNLSNPTDTVGIGGVSADYTEDALIAFSDGAKIYAYSLPIIISSPSPEIMDIPSLLGRDILDQWRMTYDKLNSELTFEVMSADLEVPVPPNP